VPSCLHSLPVNLAHLLAGNLTCLRWVQTHTLSSNDNFCRASSHLPRLNGEHREVSVYARIANNLYLEGCPQSSAYRQTRHFHHGFFLARSARLFTQAVTPPIVLSELWRYKPNQTAGSLSISRRHSSPRFKIRIRSDEKSQAGENQVLAEGRCYLHVQLDEVFS